MRIVSNEQMRNLDADAITKVGIPSIVLMENAGVEAARIITKLFENKSSHQEILIFCGKGKNGGDGLVVARHLIKSGQKVRIFLVHPESEYKAEALQNLQILKNQRAKITWLESVRMLVEYFQSAPGPFYTVDALLGTGLSRSLQGIYYDVVEALNKYADEIVALDIPTGVDGDSGKVAGTSILATATISFGFPRLGHFLAPGAAKRGRLFHVDLGFPRTWLKEGDSFLLTHGNTASLLQSRDRYGHKNSFGHCLLIGGAPGRLGAIVMAGTSCLKMGTGLVTVASWKESFPQLEIKLPSEIMNFRIHRDGTEYVVPKPGLSAFSSVVVGPGLGQEAEGAELMKQLLRSYSGPMVIDADGLNLVAEHKLWELLAKRRETTVLTPHPGEMARLLDVTKDKVLDDPMGAVREAADKTGAIVVLKGATTLIYATNNTTWLNHYPNDGMATAGSGDVLAGIIGGLLGQRMSGIDATRLGVFLHSLSGKFAAEQFGHRAMTALDIIDNLKWAFKDLREFQSTSSIPVSQELR